MKMDTGNIAKAAFFSGFLLLLTRMFKSELYSSVKVQVLKLKSWKLLLNSQDIKLQISIENTNVFPVNVQGAKGLITWGKGNANDNNQIGYFNTIGDIELEPRSKKTIGLSIVIDNVLLLDEISDKFSTGTAAQAPYAKGFLIVLINKKERKIPFTTKLI